MILRISFNIRNTLSALALALATACGDGSDSKTTDAGATDALPGSDAGTTPDTAADATSSDGATAPAAVIDTDIAVVKLKADGTPDPAFGTGGILTVNFGPNAGSVRDSVWGIARDAQNRIVLFGAGKGESARTDQDRLIARVTTTGALDTTFGTMGVYRLNIGNLADNVRHGLVQPDGKIVSSGYTNQPTGVGSQSANKIVLARLDDAGKPDPTFGYMGIVNSAPLLPADPTRMEWGMAEAYSVGFQSGKYVTTGYGRLAPSGTVDMVSFRYAENGDLDTTWGNKGAVTLDLAGFNDRGRNLAVLPDGRVLVVGSASPTMTEINALAVMLQPNGALDTSFNALGQKLWDFGRPDEAFYGVAANDRWAVAVGYRAGDAAGVKEDDDATLAFLPLAAGGTEVAKAVPLSETLNDRFWSVTFGPDGKAYAAGYLAAGTDHQMVVARYESTGALDPTFGKAGVATVNVVAAGNVETARGIVVLPDGTIVIAGEVERK